MANFLTRLRRASVTYYQPETLAYQAAILANSGTISASSLLAVDTFVATCKLMGLWGNLLDVGVFAGDQLAAALVKLVSATSGQATLTNHNFVSGDYTETGSSGGLTGNGTTKYLQTGLAASPSTQAIAFYNRTVVNNASLRTMLGSGETAAKASQLNHSTTADLFSFESGAASVTQNNLAAFYAGSALSATDRRLYINGAQVASDVTSHAVSGIAEEFYVFANNANGTAQQWWSGTGSFYAIANALQPADIANLYSAVQALQISLNRNV